MKAAITVELEHAEALVLWNLLERIDASFVAGHDSKIAVTITDMAELMALWATKAQLDRQLVEMFDPNYRALLASAQCQLREKSGGWSGEG